MEENLVFFPEHSHEHSHAHTELHAFIGVALVLGFIFMLLVDQLSGGAHSHSISGIVIILNICKANTNFSIKQILLYRVGFASVFISFLHLPLFLLSILLSFTFFT